MTITVLNCPNCGGQLQPADSSGQTQCQYCGALLQIAAPTAASPGPASVKELAPPLCPICRRADQVDLVARAHFRLQQQRQMAAAQQLAQPPQPEPPDEGGVGGLLKSLSAAHRDRKAAYQRDLAQWRVRDARYRKLRYCYRDNIVFYPGEGRPVPPSDLAALLNPPI